MPRHPSGDDPRVVAMVTCLLLSCGAADNELDDAFTELRPQALADTPARQVAQVRTAIATVRHNRRVPLPELDDHCPDCGQLLSAHPADVAP